MFKIRCILKTIDRPAMTLDVLREFSECNINILSMEVLSGHITTYCYSDHPPDIPYLKKCLHKYPEIINSFFEPEDSVVTREFIKPELPHQHGFIFISEAMNKLISNATKMANNSYPVFIQGESGTGKELLARFIHNASSRRTNPFIPINCSALPENLMESEFFGYEAGAFSGANSNGKKGLFEKADHGTLFLDEFGELPIGLQAKLLRVLQDGNVRRICGADLIPVDVKIIVATNANLKSMIARQQLRLDLYYRINVLPLVIPPLRERPEDIPLLLSYFIDKYEKEFACHISLDKTLVQYIYNYSWPGNVRELENIVIRCAVLADERIVRYSDLELDEFFLDEVKINNNIFPLKEQVKMSEKRLIEKMLAQHASSRSIARMLGVSHTTVINRIKHYRKVRECNPSEDVIRHDARIG